MKLSFSKNRDDYEQLLNLIGGELLPSGSNEWIDNFEPATGQKYSQLPDSNEKDIETAVRAAGNAFPAWSGLSQQERSLKLRELANAIKENEDLFVWAESVDSGKPVYLTKNVDIPRCSMNLEFFADMALNHHGESYRLNETIDSVVERNPLGVVGIISPWNLPLYSLTWKLAPALAVGNCVVAKPSEVTPLTAYLFSHLVKQYLPAGVLNIVHGRGATAGEAITKNPKVKALSFTGSTATGRRIAQTSSEHFRKLALEMGGKNPTIVFADSDLEKAARGAVKAAYTNQGQVCLCGSRILVAEEVYDEFKLLFINEAKKLSQGDPLEPSTQQGAVVSQVQFEKVRSYLELALKEGGTVLMGGLEKPIVPDRCKEGWFVAPTLIEGLSNECRTNQEEIFGPVSTLQSFSSVEEALQLANDTSYGLSASVWTKNLDLARKASKQLDVGIVWVNTWMARDLRTPFGGAKNSGLGREGGMEALHFFTEAKTTTIQYEF